MTMMEYCFGTHYCCYLCIAKKMGWQVDEGLQSGTMTRNEPTKLLV